MRVAFQKSGDISLTVEKWDRSHRASLHIFATIGSQGKNLRLAEDEKKSPHLHICSCLFVIKIGSITNRTATQIALAHFYPMDYAGKVCPNILFLFCTAQMCRNRRKATLEPLIHNLKINVWIVFEEKEKRRFSSISLQQ